jgi:hypothetical protein
LQPETEIDAVFDWVIVPVYVEPIWIEPTVMLLSIITFFELVASKMTSSPEPGKVSPDQFAASLQLFVAPPPSHVFDEKAFAELCD